MRLFSMSSLMGAAKKIGNASFEMLKLPFRFSSFLIENRMLIIILAFTLGSLDTATAQRLPRKLGLNERDIEIYKDKVAAQACRLIEIEPSAGTVQLDIDIPPEGFKLCTGEPPECFMIKSAFVVFPSEDYGCKDGRYDLKDSNAKESVYLDVFEMPAPRLEL